MTAQEGAARDRLLEEAIAYVGEHGIADLSLRTLGAALGTSHRMLIYHFGSKEGLYAAIVAELERRNLALLQQLIDEPDITVPELSRRFWKQISDPAALPFAKLFFEIYAHALQGRPHAQPLLEAALDPWFDAITELHRRQGMSPARARAHAHYGVAATRGLILDLLATQDRRVVDQAMKLQIELYELDLENLERKGRRR